MTKEEFCRLYVEHMMKLAGRETWPDGESIREYAEYSAEETWRADKATVHPETAAEVDVSYWEED